MTDPAMSDQMQQTVRWSESIKTIAPAIVAAQATMGKAIKDKENPHFKSKYADLDACWDACRKPLADNGLAVLQFPLTETTTLIRLETILLHKSGEWYSATSEMPVSKQDPQGHVGAYTYLRRATLSAVVGIAPEDDDGNTASSGTGATFKTGSMPANNRLVPNPDASTRKPAPNAGDETRRTVLRNEFVEICKELRACDDEPQIDGLEAGYNIKLGEILRGRPDLFDGGGDIPSWDDRVAAKRKEVRAKQPSAPYSFGSRKE